MINRNKALITLALFVAIFPWLPFYFELAGLEQATARFWTVVTLFSAACIVGFFFVGDIYD